MWHSSVGVHTPNRFHSFTCSRGGGKLHSLFFSSWKGEEEEEEEEEDDEDKEEEEEEKQLRKEEEAVLSMLAVRGVIRWLCTALMNAVSASPTKEDVREGGSVSFLEFVLNTLELICALHNINSFFFSFFFCCCYGGGGF